MLSDAHIFDIIWHSTRVQIEVGDKIDGVCMSMETGDFGPVVEFKLKRYFGKIDLENPEIKEAISYKICTGIVGGLSVDFPTHHTLLREALSCFTNLVQIHLGHQNLSTLVVNAIRELRGLESVHISSCKSVMSAVQELIKELMGRKPFKYDDYECRLRLARFGIDHITPKKTLFEIDCKNKHPAKEVHLIMKNIIIEDSYVQLKPDASKLERLDQFLRKIDLSEITHQSGS